MNSFKPSIPGIVNIYRTDADGLPDFFEALAENGFRTLLPFLENIDFVGIPKLIVKSERKKGGVLYKSSLTFDTQKPLSTVRNKLSFVVKYEDGTCMVVGSKSAPADCPALAFSSGTPESEPSVYSYEISCSSFFKPVKLIF